MILVLTFFSALCNRISVTVQSTVHLLPMLCVEERRGSRAAEEGPGCHCCPPSTTQLRPGISTGRKDEESACSRGPLSQPGEDHRQDGENAGRQIERFHYSKTIWILLYNIIMYNFFIS